MKAHEHAKAAFGLLDRRKVQAKLLGFVLVGRLNTPTRQAIQRELQAAQREIVQGREMTP